MSSQTVPEHAEIPPPTIEEVSDGIFAYIQLDGSWFLNNAGAILGADGAVVVDTVGTEARARAFRKAYDELTGLPPQVLINTHSHGDHTHGNFMFAPRTAIVGHENCRQEMLAAGTAVRALFPTTDFGDIPETPPFVTFQDRLNVYAGDLRLELIYVGPSHTPSDVVVWVPERKLLFAGDIVFNGGTPFAIAGSVAGWRETLEILRGLGAATVVPGHGPVCGPESFDAVDDYLSWIQEIAADGFERGTPPLDLATGLDLGRFSALSDPERLVPNLHRAYSELRGEERGIPLDRGAFLDMITYNGGGPLRCLA
jgi:cyclase